MSNLNSIMHVIMVEDMSRAITFYQTVFGLELRFRSDQWSVLNDAGSQIGLHAGGKGERIKTWLSFQMEDVHSACECIKDAGGAIEQEPQHREGEPVILATALDTEGNEIMLTQQIH